MERPDWRGRTVVCLASGPSLTKEDCDAVRAAGHVAIVTNTTFRDCPWADVLFAFDARWWREYIDEVRFVFAGRLVSASQVVGKLGVDSTWGQSWFKHAQHSGACALALAVAGIPKRVVMLGFDCQIVGEKSHHHGEHPKGMSNCASIARWPRQIRNVAEYAREQGVEVINSSRETALTCFERRPLAEVI